MANRIGGCPDKKRLLPGVGYPIPISPAAAPSGGFASPVLLWPYGFGEATTNDYYGFTFENMATALGRPKSRLRGTAA